MSKNYVTGTIKVKNAVGNLVEFLPKTDPSNVFVESANCSLSQLSNSIKSQIDELGGIEGIKILYEEADAENTATFKNKTLIGSIVPLSDEASFSCSKNKSTYKASYYCDEAYTISVDLFNGGNVSFDSIKLIIDSNEYEYGTFDIAESKTIVYNGTISRQNVEYSVLNNAPVILHPKIVASYGNETIEKTLDPISLNCIPANSSYYNPNYTINLLLSSTSSSIHIQCSIKNIGKAWTNEPCTTTVTILDGLETTTYTEHTNYQPNDSPNFAGYFSYYDVPVAEENILSTQPKTVTVNISGTSFDGTPINVTSTKTLPIPSPNPSLRVEYINSSNWFPVNGQFKNNSHITYRLYVKNNGNITLSNISIQDINTEKTFQIASLSPGESQGFTDDDFAYTIPEENDGVVELTCIASADNPSSNATIIDLKPLTLVTENLHGITLEIYPNQSAKFGIPFRPTSDAKMFIIWGDDSSIGTISSGDVASNRIHSYNSYKNYNVAIAATDWSKIAVDISTGSPGSSTPLYYFRYGLVSITSAFPQMSSITSFAYMFYNCTYLTSIHSGLFSLNTQVSSYSYCFSGCTSLATVNSSIFEGCTSATNFSYCFYNCSALTTVSDYVFKNCTAATNFYYCFYGCSQLSSLAGNIFEGCQGATDLSYCFHGCRSLTAIPSGLFDSCINATTFKQIFRNCTYLQTIPEGLFQYNTAATNMAGMFWSCTNIQSIPANLFQYNVNVTNFGALFACSGGPAFTTQTFPVDLLANCTKITTLADSSYGFFESSSIRGFELRLTARNITSADYFISSTSSGYTRKVYVPNGSTTASTMSGISGITLIRE